MSLVTIKIEEETIKSENLELLLCETKDYLDKMKPKCKHKWKSNIRPGGPKASVECKLCGEKKIL